MIVSLATLKAHCRADDTTADDAILTHYLEAAEAAVINQVGRGIEDLEEMGGGRVPLQIKQAVLLLAGHWYNQREAASATAFKQIAFGVGDLIAPFVKLKRSKQ